MRLEEYTQKRAEEERKRNPRFRGLCLTCFHPSLTCYCRHVQRFDPKIRFVILIQYREAQKKIATGRISHLCLENSLLIGGYNYTNEPKVNALLADPSMFPVVLYPGEESVNLSRLPPASRLGLFPKEKELLVFVIDGTWTTARKIVQRSENLRNLPRICFDPPRPSNFRLRKQPQDHCFSTVEAIHYSIELLGESRGFPVAERGHDALLRVFDAMVEQQLELAKQHKPRFVRF